MFLLLIYRHAWQPAGTPIQANSWPHILVERATPWVSIVGREAVSGRR
jgi:hypothetical protein